MIPPLVPSPFLFDKSAVVTPRTDSVGNAGTPQWVNTSGAITIPANCQPVSSRDALQYGRVTENNIYEVYLPSAQVTLTQAQLKLAKVVVDGRTLRVFGNVNPITNGAVVVLTCEEVDT